MIIIPKSVHIERMEQNLDIFNFELTDEEMAEIATLDTGKVCSSTIMMPKLQIVYELAIDQKISRSDFGCYI